MQKDGKRYTMKHKPKENWYSFTDIRQIRFLRSFIRDKKEHSEIIDYGIYKNSKFTCTQ